MLCVIWIVSIQTPREHVQYFTTKVSFYRWKLMNLLYLSNQSLCPCTSEVPGSQGGITASVWWLSEAKTLLCNLTFHCKIQQKWAQNAFVEMEIDHKMIMPCNQWIKYFEPEFDFVRIYLAFLHRQTTKTPPLNPAGCQNSSLGFLLMVIYKSFHVVGQLLL